MRLRFMDKPLFVWMRILSKRRPVKHLSEFLPDRVGRILIVSSTALGDTVLSTPAIRAIRMRYRNAKITAHFHRKYLPLFRNNPHIDDIIPYYGGYKRFFATIREFQQHNFDLVVILHGNGPQAIPMAYLSNAPFIIRIPNKTEYRFLLSNSYLIPENDVDPNRHGVQDRLATAGLVGCDTSNINFELPIDEAKNYTAREKLSAMNCDPDQYDLVGFQAGASKKIRVWPADKFIELGKKLQGARKNIRVVLFGSPIESRICNKIASSIGGNAISIAGLLPIEFLGALVKQLSLLITPDTGTMHVAAAVKTPTVCLYASANPVKTAPLQDKELHTVIRSPQYSNRHRAMQDIQVTPVYDAAMARLEFCACDTVNILR